MMERAERHYVRLLVILPRALRREAEAELLDVFREEHRRVAGRGVARLALFWARMAADLAAASLAERAAMIRRAAAAPSLHERTPMDIARTISNVAADVRLAARRLGRTPAWTLLASGTLAIGLAASLVAAVLVRDVLLRPLPFPGADRLVRIQEVSDNGRTWWPSIPNALDWREHARMFDGVAIADIPRVVPVLLAGRAVRVPVSRAARGLFETLGVRPAAGRLFRDDENRAGGAPVVVVSARFWRTELHAQPVDQVALTVDDARYTVIGVLPADFRFLGDGGAWTEPADIWTPMDRDTNRSSRTSHGVHVVGRLREGVTLDQARAEMNALTKRLKAEHREPTQADAARLTPLKDMVVRAARAPLQLLLYAAVAVLLVSCLNLAAAVLAQGLGRARELSVRLAIGASRGVIARHLLIEAAVLSVPGALLGLAMTAIGLDVLRTNAPGNLPRLEEAALDPQAIGIAFGLAAITATLAGLLPAVVLSRRTIVGRLRSHGGSTGPREQRRLWTGFVVAQVTLTVLLLAGTGLLIRSFLAALAVDVGYDARRVLAADVALPEATYANAQRRVAYYDAALERLRSTPGIRAAGLTSALPHITSIFTGGTSRERDPAHEVMAATRLVDAGYFDAIGIRGVEDANRALQGNGAVIDRRLASQLWPASSPFGDRVISPFASTVVTVNGVAGTVREWNQADDETTGVVYVDFHRHPARTQTMHFVVRHDGREARAIQAVHDALASVDAMVPATITPLASLAAESLASRRLQLLLAIGFGAIAVVLAASGVYAMVTFVTGRQVRERAIRLALGADPSSLRYRVIGHGLAPAAAGVCAGIVFAIPLGNAMRAQLFHVRPFDPLVLGCAALVVVIAAAGASAIPARTAARIEPAAALRQD